MNSTQTKMFQHLDTALSASSVLAQTRSFLESCGWKLEIDNHVIAIPKNVELVVRSRAFVKADLDEVFLGDHLEAVVLLGKEFIGENVCAQYGVLRMYFNLYGQFVSEDHYNKHA